MNASMYASGGRLKRGKMVIAHFNPDELNGLDYLQGKRETCPRTGMRSYSHLEELLKNPHLLSKLMQVFESNLAKKRQHRARGGSLHDYHDPRLNRMANEGVHGDTELALIGPHTQHVFDHLVAMEGHPVAPNPHTGHPHYGFLDGILGGISGMLGKIPIVGPAINGLVSGIGNTVKSILPGLAPAAGQLAQKYLPQIGEHFGGETGKNLANMGAQFINQAATQGATPEQLAQGQALADRASSFGQNAFDTYQQGGIGGLARNLGGQALNQMGEMAGGTPGGIISQLGRGVQSGQGFGQLAQGVKNRFMPQGGEGGIDFGSLASRAGQYASQGLQGLKSGRSFGDVARGLGGNALRDVSGYAGGDLGEYGNQLADRFGA